MSKYRVLLRPALIVPEPPNNKLTIAEEGTIVKLMDMRTMFRDRISPITHRPDEILVGWGKKGKEQLGWLASNTIHGMKQVEGPLFLVKTRDKNRMTPWDRIRHAIARADAKQVHKHRWWLVPWSIVFAKDHLPDIKKTIREYGGKVKSTEDVDMHVDHLVNLILKTEFDMATARKEAKSTKKGKKGAKTADKLIAKNKKNKGKKADTKSTAEAPAKAPKKYDPRTREYDGFLIKRLVKENPRKAGTSKAKMWDKLKKGMSIEEFVEKGGTRGAVAKYIQKGWVKLLRPKGDE